MATVNKKAEVKARTHEGAPAIPFLVNQASTLRRSVMACMLWEDSFYEQGESIAKRIAELVPNIEPVQVAQIAFEARTRMKLRHVPLLIAREMARHKSHSNMLGYTLYGIICRPDELSEFVALYWKDKKQPLSAQVKKGLAKAFTKFNEYELAKYNRDRAVKLRDVLMLCHPYPLDPEQSALWKRLLEGKLQTPDTWEVALSAGKDKKETWERLIAEKKLGALALLRNLRNMEQAGVSRDTMREAINKMKTDVVLPFRFLTAAKYAAFLEPELEQAMLRAIDRTKTLTGRTALIIDVSGSMDSTVAGKTELTAMDAAAALAILIREMGEVDVYTFSNFLVQVPSRRGFALKEAIISSQAHGGTALGAALRALPKESGGARYDRTIVITDEQSSDVVGGPGSLTRGYMVNVGPYQNGIGYGEWTRITGWSEQIAKYIVECESLSAYCD